MQYLALLLALTTSTLAYPATPSQKFRLIVATPTLPTLVPNYLSAEGSVTSTKKDAAVCYTSEEQLFCGAVPIGAPRAAAAYPFQPYDGKDAVTTAISIERSSQLLRWLHPGVGSIPGGITLPVLTPASFWYKLDGSEEVWAVFEGAQTTDSVIANLYAEFE
ncbi:hypothetical protein B0O99DRAFT_16037 [Bisporella sp. PMI_857]|nr:hypothetical protein B0O99DRAFT_16037 [Bisporella sp. PMI_857]